MRAPRVAKGLRPLTKLERRQIRIANARAGFPNVLHQRFELTIQAFEARLLEAKGNAQIEQFGAPLPTTFHKVGGA